ncbi:MAG TPA: hypothetical protein VED59_00995, partial [Acidimicrobiales bacterium]|nr:hypothetical protein [Acidimicrobiales bacterium]
AGPATSSLTGSAPTSCSSRLVRWRWVGPLLSLTDEEYETHVSAAYQLSPGPLRAGSALSWATACDRG